VEKGPVITDIVWERVFLHFALEGQERRAVCLAKPPDMSRDGAAMLREESAPASAAAPESAEASFRCINMAAAKGRSFLENGKWLPGSFSDEGGFAPCTLAPGLALRLDGLARVFRYSGPQAYTVSFEPYAAGGGEVGVYIDSRFMREDRRWKRRRFQPEMASGESPLRQLLYLIYRRCLNALYRPVAFALPKNGGRILFISDDAGSFRAGQEAGNIGAIIRRLRERSLDGRLHVSHSVMESGGDLRNAFLWARTALQIAASDVVVLDGYTPVLGSLKLDRRTRLVQVWHSGLGFKAVGYCRFGKQGSPHPYECCHRQYDCAICDSPELAKVYEEVFGIEPEAVIPTGLPRMEWPSDPARAAATREAFFSEYPGLRGKKLILFAPTYRGNGRKDAYYDYTAIDFGRLRGYCGEARAILVRMHHFIGESPPIAGCSPEILDFSGYPDISVLYQACDILITDYSSAYYEFAATGKPILFYTYDRIAYQATRGTHQDIKSTAPGKVCDTFDGLMAALEGEDFEQEKTLEFRERHFGAQARDGADRVIDEIILREAKAKEK